MCVYLLCELYDNYTVLTSRTTYTSYVGVVSVLGCRLSGLSVVGVGLTYVEILLEVKVCKPFLY